MNDRDGRAVIVTGGSSGIGLEIARAFGRNGDRVVITGRNEEALASAVSELESEGLEAFCVAGSVSDEQHVDQLIERTLSEHGSVDVVVNNAGIDIEGEVIDLSVDDWDTMMETNLKGVFLVSRRAARAMRSAGTGGVILMTTSINVTMPEARGVPYSATKAAVANLLQGLALELVDDGIRVCGVAPGYIDTEMLAKTIPDPAQLEAWKRETAKAVPMRRFAQPSEIAPAFVFLASPEASYITGTSLVVDGGRLAAA